MERTLSGLAISRNKAVVSMRGLRHTNAQRFSAMPQPAKFRPSYFDQRPEFFADFRDRPEPEIEAKNGFHQLGLINNYVKISVLKSAARLLDFCHAAFIGNSQPVINPPNSVDFVETPDDVSTDPQQTVACSPHPAALHFARLRDLALSPKSLQDNRENSNSDGACQLGEAFRAIRRTKGFTRDTVAARLHCEIEEIVALENGYGNLQTAKNLLQKLQGLEP